MHWGNKHAQIQRLQITTKYQQSQCCFLGMRLTRYLEVVIEVTFNLIAIDKK